MLNKKIIVGIITSIAGSLCCITPVVAVMTGSIGMASSMSWIEPARPYLIGLTIFILGYAWWDKLKPQKLNIECACNPDENGKISFWHTKTFLMIVTLFSTVMLTFPYWGSIFINSDKPKVIYVKESNIITKTIDVDGMTCQTCEATVQKAGSNVSGVTKIIASSFDGNAIVTYDKSKTDVKSIMKAINDTGYQATGYENGK